MATKRLKELLETRKTSREIAGKFLFRHRSYKSIYRALKIFSSSSGIANGHSHGSQVACSLLDKFMN